MNRSCLMCGTLTQGVYIGRPLFSPLRRRLTRYVAQG